VFFSYDYSVPGFVESQDFEFTKFMVTDAIGL